MAPPRIATMPDPLPPEAEGQPPPVELPITGELDLHTFRARDVPSLLPDYFRECQAKGIFRVRVIHGKGTGQLREKVRALLARLPEVAAYEPAAEWEGGWGATVVRLNREAHKS